MDNSSIFVLAGASLFFGFLFGFNVGIKYDIELKVTYHPRPTPWETKDLSQDDFKKIETVL